MDYKTVNKMKLKYEIIISILSIILIVAWIVGIIVGVALVALLEDLEAFTIGILIPALVSGVIYGVYLKFKKQSLKFKEEYVLDQIKKQINNVDYRPKEGISYEEAFKSGLFVESKGFESEDYLLGEINNTKFIFSDVYFSSNIRSEKMGSGKVHFKGQLYVFDISKELENPVYVIPKMSNIFKKGEELITVESEWIEFDKKFNIYAKTAVEAFYALNPAFMARLANANNREGKIMFSFISNKLYVAINSNIDTFDLRLFRRFDESFLQEINEQIVFVNEIIKALT